MVRSFWNIGIFSVRESGVLSCMKNSGVPSESWNHILKICIPRNIRILPGETSGPKGGGSDDPTPADRAWREKMIHLRDLV